MKKKKIVFRSIVIAFFLCLGLIKCSPPSLLLSTFDIHSSSIERALSAERSVWNQLGIHEYYGHGIKGWKGDRDHWRCYQAQMKHPSYQKLPLDQKKEIYGRYNAFYKKSQGY